MRKHICKSYRVYVYVYACLSPAIFFSRVYLIFCISGGIWQHRKKNAENITIPKRNWTNEHELDKQTKKNNNKCEATHSTTIAITQTERNRTLPIIFLFSFDTLYFHPFHTVHIAIGGYSKLIWLFTFLTFACLLDVWFFCSLLPSSKYTINKDAIFPINNHKWRWILLN